MEKWKDINGYEDYYQISSFGRVKSKKRHRKVKSNGKQPIPEKIHSQYIGSNGYPLARLSVDGNQKRIPIHRLVASHFISDIPIEMVVNHIDGNPKNNNVDNLEIVTYFDNIRHGRINKKSTSKYIGVFYDCETDKWRAQLSFDGNRYSLGRYKLEEDAYNAVLNKMNEIGIDTKYKKSVLQNSTARM